MSKHTPGPWRVDSGPGNTTQVRAGREHIANVSDYHFVSTPAGTKHVYVGPANGALIAAAPDLLDDVKAMLDLLDDADLDDEGLEIFRTARAHVRALEGR